jgi:hypothetical protein
LHRLCLFPSARGDGQSCSNRSAPRHLMAPTLAALRLLSTRLSAADTSGFALKSTTDTDRFAEYISRPVAGNSDDQHLHAALRTRRSRMGRRDFRLYGHLSLQRRPPNNTRASTEDAIELAVDSGGFVLSDHRAAFAAVTGTNCGAPGYCPRTANQQPFLPLCSAVQSSA